ncbi:MAG: O-antigen ligase family protein [Prevotella sp.]|nr:O-antigen ligase family protein [Prevotella sp.]
MTGALAYTQNHGGRVIVLFLLFLLALYQFSTVGFVGFAAVAALPAVLLFLYLAVKHQNALFWYIFTMNYFVMGLQRYGYIPLPVTVVAVLPQILLLMSLIIIDHPKKNSMMNPMLLGIILWTFYLILQVFNDTCGLPLSVGDWLMNINFYALYFIIAYVLINKIINTPENILRFLRLWAYFSIAAAFWAWRQQTFGWDNAENAWLMGGAMRTHIIGGSIRYFSFFSDAANFGCNIGSSAVAFYVLTLTSKLKKDKVLFLIAALCSTYGFFASGTRSGLMCFMVGVLLYVFLSKSIKLTSTVVVLGGLFVFFLAFTDIGNGNMQIRRMRTAFDSNDASKNVRDINKEALAKYLQDAPFGMGINIDEGSIPAFNKFRVVYETSNDSTYVFFWQRTGIVGVYVFAAMNILILLGGCFISLFRLTNKSCKGIAAALCCAFLAIQAGGYANHILLQYPNIILFYGGMAIVYLLPAIEQDFIDYEDKLSAIQEEKKRLRLEKKKQSRVKSWFSWT